MIIALATPRVASSIDEGLRKIEQCLADAAGRGAEIVCFPEAYLPGLRGLDFDVPSFDAAQQSHALAEVAQLARTFNAATILGTERLTEAGLQIVGVVFNADGNIQGMQTKNQTTVIGPSGECISYLPYGEEGVLVQAIDPETATGLLASRYAPERYEESVPD